MNELPKNFLDLSVEFLAGHYLPKIEQSVAPLQEEDIWWRPNRESNSIGNLILHLSGNIRQWIISGIGKAKDTRVRTEEFEAEGGISKNDLIGRLRNTIQEACSVLKVMEATRLGEPRLIQGNEVSLLYAVYHVVEHCSMHTGQIIQIAKQKTAKGIEFYAFEKGKPVEKWRR